MVPVLLITILVFGAEELVKKIGEYTLKTALGKLGHLIRRKIKGELPDEFRKKAEKILLKLFRKLTKVICLDKDNKKEADKLFKKMIKKGVKGQKAFNAHMKNVNVLMTSTDNKKILNAVAKQIITGLKEANIQLKPEYENKTRFRKEIFILVGEKFTEQIHLLILYNDDYYKLHIKDIVDETKADSTKLLKQTKKSQKKFKKLIEENKKIAGELMTYTRNIDGLDKEIQKVRKKMDKFIEEIPEDIKNLPAKFESVIQDLRDYIADKHEETRTDIKGHVDVKVEEIIDKIEELDKIAVKKRSYKPAIDKKKISIEKSKKLLLRYLDKLMNKYIEMEKNFNLIDRVIDVGNIPSNNKGFREEQLKWHFIKEDGLSWLFSKIHDKNHILIEGEMGIGKTTLVLAIAYKLALKAKECINKEKFSELVFPVFIPLQQREYFRKYKLEIELKGNRNAWLSEILSYELDDIKNKKQINDYLESFIRKKPDSFVLLFDAYDEYPYKQVEGKLAPKNLFGIFSTEYYWDGAVILTSRPNLLNDIQYAIYRKVSKGEKNFSFTKVPRFTDSEIQEFLQNRPLFINFENTDEKWGNFQKTIINEIWKKFFDDDWRIPLFLWALSEVKKEEAIPTNRSDLFHFVFQYIFNWYYGNKDKYILRFSDQKREKYYTIRNQRIIIISPQPEKEISYTIRPNYFYTWLKELFKNLAYSMSYDNRNQFSRQELMDVIKELEENLGDFTLDNLEDYYNLIINTMDDGHFIISLTTDVNGKLCYSFTPWRLLEAFTAMKFIELDEDYQINSLKQLLPKIENMRETICLCWQMLVEKKNCDHQARKLFIQACPDLQSLFELEKITPLGHLTYSIKEISKKGDEIRVEEISIFGINLDNLTFLNRMNELQKLSINNRYDFYDNGIIDISPIKYLTNLQELILDSIQITDLTLLENLTNLEVIVLRSDKGGLRRTISDLTPLMKLLNLRYLSIEESQISDISKLENLTCLKVIDLGGNQITDLSPLKKLTNLEKLYVSGNKITDISPLRNLIKLEDLRLGGNKITDVTPLKKLVNLKTLGLSRNKIINIPPLRELTNLKVLYMDYAQITDLTPLENMINLQNLHLRGNEITDITPLRNLIHLKYLFMDDNIITNLTPLENLTNLTSLSLRINNVTDITPLRNIIKLKVLSLSSNQITDFSSLEKLTNLETLSLSNNQITDLKIIEKFTKLQGLFMSDNQVNDLTFLEKLTNLSRLNLDGNPITNIAVLENTSEIRELDLQGIQTKSLDISPIVFHKFLTSFRITSDLQLLCKRELIDKITCPALLEKRNQIRSID